MLIVFDGIDRAGKSTHMKLIARWLQSQGKSFILKREPGGTPISEKIRNIFVHNELDPLTGLFLLSASRRTLTLEIAKLGKDKLILCDRFVDSTYAYQGQHLETSVIDNFVKLSAVVEADFTFLFLNMYKSRNMTKMDEDALKNKSEIINRFAQRAALNPQKYFAVPHGKIKKQNSLIQQKLQQLLEERGLW